MGRDSTLRLFVGVYPALEQAEAMLAAMRELDPAPHRATPAAQAHCTVLFIGDRAVRELDETRESVERSASGVRGFTLTPRRLMTLPERGKPRLIALETDGPPELREIHRRLVSRLARNPRDRKSGRFLPHFTLCRFKHGGRGRRADVPVDPGEVGGVIEVREIRLMRSALRPEGALHEVVERYPLEGS